MSIMEIKRTLCMWIIVVILFQFSSADTLLPEYFKNLYSEHKEQIARIYGDYLTRNLGEINIETNRIDIFDTILSLIFYHALFTSKEAVNCIKGGILDIPYFWHWVNPNPRYSLIYLPDQKPLFKTKPPKGFEKYKSYADIDRTPFIYFSNLVSDSALFYHPDCGDIYTFGWCSEREMAFSNLMTILGYKSKIKQSGIHVWSEILIDIKSDKGVTYIIVSIDNTFNQISYSVLNGPKSKWKIDYGEGTQATWYNKKALSQNELQLVKNIQMSEKTKLRIDKKTKDWLSKK